MNSSYFKSQLRKGINTTAFNAFCLDLFRFQAINNPVYRQFLGAIHCDPQKVASVREIPFLPISFFKSHDVICEGIDVKEIFTSSGTTGSQASRHLAHDPELYLENTVRNFTAFYGDPSQYTFLALLPGYLERSGSSLIKMVDHFIQLGKGGFFLRDYDKLKEELEKSRIENRKTILIGVTHALLDLASTMSLENYPSLIVMETGGMKGHGKELVREELHLVLKNAFKVDAIHSEYGMTELFSQAYSQGEGKFKCPDSMKILIREVTDPFTYLPDGRTGAINTIDLANIDSIAFIATDDLGKIHPDSSFEILGRTDQSDLRGCNLLIN